MPTEEKIANSLSGEWQVPLCSTLCRAPQNFFKNFFCPCCVAYSHRQQLLEITNEPYVCCAGMIGCGPCMKPCNPRCLALEVCCCMQFAIAGNRFMIQTRFDKRNTPCDSFILWCTAVVACVNCVIQTVSDQDCSVLQAIVDIIVCTVNACMQTQHEFEIRHVREHAGYKGAPQFVVVLLPSTQQQYILIAPPQQQQMANMHSS